MKERLNEPPPSQEAECIDSTMTDLQAIFAGTPRGSLRQEPSSPERGTRAGLIHVLVCTNRRDEGHPLPSCGPRGGEELIGAFRSGIVRHGLDRVVKVTATACLTPCLNGPNVVIYPEAVWYCTVTPDDVDEILTAHVEGLPPVERLLLPKSVRVL